MKYWLIKSEPSTFSIDDLKNEKKACWEGVRNFQARNFMRDEMSVGDLAIFYHSSVKPPAAVGVATICSEAYPDHFAWDTNSNYFDSRSTKEKPLWFMVDVCFKQKFKKEVTLDEIKNDPCLIGVMVAQKGVRLSIQPMSKNHFKCFVQLGKR